jgi:hypothetical protein
MIGAGMGVMPGTMRTWLPRPHRWPEQIVQVAQCGEGHHNMTRRIAPAWISL